MKNESPLNLPGDKLRKALADYAELQREHPEKKKSQILNEIQKKYDLSPLECAFLERQLSP